MIIRRVSLDVVTPNPEGILELRFRKEEVEDATGQVVSFGYHRTTLEPGASLTELLTANNRSFGTMGLPNVTAVDTAL